MLTSESKFRTIDCKRANVMIQYSKMARNREERLWSLVNRKGQGPCSHTNRGHQVDGRLAGSLSGNKTDGEKRADMHSKRIC